MGKPKFTTLKIQFTLVKTPSSRIAFWAKLSRKRCPKKCHFLTQKSVFERFRVYNLFTNFWDTLYCVIWSQHAQNIFLESLEVFLKIFQKIFFIPHFLKIFCPRMQVSLMQKISLPRGWEHPKIAHRPKNRFFQSPRYRHPNPTTEKETSN